MGRVLHPAGKYVRLEGAELVCGALDDERLHPFEHDPELLVRMAVQWHGRAGLEADQVQHRTFAEQRTAGDARG